MPVRKDEMRGIRRECSADSKSNEEGVLLWS